MVIKKRRTIKTLLKFRYAWRGIKYTFKTQKSFRWQLLLGIIALIVFRDFGVLVFAGLILFAELINTAIEKLCNFVYPHHDRSIGLIKDISAGAVTVLCICSVLYAISLVVRWFLL